MAQKRTDYSKFTRSNGTLQVLMLWTSVALHLMIGSNLGLFGRLDPIKVKPAGGTVRVVDLTPAEQTRVPEAAKARPLPIAQTPVNPEPATRNQAASAGAVRANFSPSILQSNSPQLPSPSSQIPPPTVRQPNPPAPIPSTSKKSGKADIPIVPRPPRSSQQDNEGTFGENQGNSNTQGKPRKKATQDSRTDSSSKETLPISPVDPQLEKPDRKNPRPPKPPASPVNPLVQLQQKFNQDIQELKNSVGGTGNTIEKEIPPESLPYTSAIAVRKIKKCKLDQSGYVLFAIMLTRDGQTIPGKPQISSFLEEEGKILYGHVLDKAFEKIKSNPVNPEKSIIYKFRYEFSPNSCEG